MLTQSRAINTPNVDFENNKVTIGAEEGKVFTQQIDDRYTHGKAEDILELDQAAPDFKLDQSPSVWFKPPPRRDPSTSMLRTYDGREFVLGGRSGFKWKQLTEDGAEIEIKNESITISLDDIQALKLPTKK